MTHETNDLTNSEGNMEFETSTKDAVNKTAMGNDQNSLKQLNFLERIILEQSDRERRSKNVLIFGVSKSSKMSYDEQRKDDDLALNEIMNELGYELTKVASSFRFKSKPNQIHDPPILLRLKSQTDRYELIGLMLYARLSLHARYFFPAKWSIRIFFLSFAEVKFSKTSQNSSCPPLRFHNFVNVCLQMRILHLYSIL